ncbi:transposase [Hahella sp. KA22]|uniref:Mu transposase C-terminal domain-containing protein n=1 Tax=Hahella sp. KA22 TaxID=1628392 RepID=UPI000FDEF7D5|nr:Mu transposase C-terminal domain-containing protein [Hahella sp. KA22]AZZ95348.1 transposase [Hahella sp. KA22]QAY52993.1 transposase [Hahella sp. KA22]
MYQVNEVLSLDGALYRVLKIVGNHLVWISVEEKAAFPTVEELSSIEKLVLDEKLVRAEDPYAYLLNEMPEPGSKAAEKRDNHFQIISPLVGAPDFYVPEVRARVIKEILETKAVSKPYLYRIVRQYWQRGQIPNALLPDYRNSGGKGKRRIAKEKKLGRPRVHAEGTGALIDESIEKLFRVVIDKYILNDEKFTLPFAHRRLKKLYDQFFPGTPESEKPTKWQLKHFYDREYGFSERAIKRIPSIVFKKDVRPLVSTATMQALGPGSRYEIDATIADIILVSDTDRNQPVGRPILYVVVDVFTRFVVGWYIGFENPSYVAAIQSLHLAMTDKNELIKSLGIECQDLDWPTPGLPEAILADRGELLGHQIEGLEASFMVRIENTPPYRGDAKGIVERNFRSLQAEFKPFAPGVVTGNTVKKRGGKNYWLDGVLTISEFTEIMISSIIMHNFVDPMERYDRSEDMPPELPSIPVHLWNWGLQNRTGRLRKADSESLRIALLPRHQATTSENGICLFGLYYSSAEVLASGWMHRSAFSNRPDKVTVAYDPDSADEIYLFFKPNSREYWTCKLTDLSREYRGSSLWEVWRKQDAKKKHLYKQKLAADKARAEHEERVESIIKSAIKETPTPTTTNSQRLASVGATRKQQLEKERKNRKPAQPAEAKSAEIISLPNVSDDDGEYPLYVDELFNDGDD